MTNPRQNAIYNCNKLGHFRNECPEPQRPRPSGGDDKAPKKRQSGGTRRAQNAVEDRQESRPEEDAEEDDEEPGSGNYKGEATSAQLLSPPPS